MRDLLPAERKRLAALEAKVEEGIAAFITTGEALREIRDERYYRDEHKTFEEYLDAMRFWRRFRARVGRKYADPTVADRVREWTS